MKMGIYMLILAELILLYIAYRHSEGDILSPPVAAVLGFLVSTLGLLPKISIWKVDLGSVTVLVIAGGLAVFLTGDMAARALNRRISSNSLKRQRNQMSAGRELHVTDIRALIISAAFLTVSAVYVIKVIQDVQSTVSGPGSLFSKLGEYRDLKDSGMIDSKVPSVLESLFSAIKVGCYPLIYLLIYDFRKGERIRLGHISLFLTITCVYVSSMITSSRMTLVTYPVFACIAFYLLNRERFLQKDRWNRLKTAAVFGGAAAAVIVLFVLVRNLVGRNDRSDPLYYISLYVSGPVKCLDSFLKEGSFDRSIFGKETFTGLNRFIGIHFNVPELVYSVHKEFVYVGNLRIGNVFTCFRAYINDFGPAGLVVLTLIQSMLMNLMNRHLREKRADESHFLRMVYSYLYFTVPLMFYAEWFYSFYFAPSFLKNLMIMALVYLFFLLDKEKIRRIYGSIMGKDHGGAADE